MHKILQTAGEFLWFPFMTALLFGGGIYISVLLGFPQAARIREVWRHTVGSLLQRREGNRGISPFAAVSTALAGTMGVGNIAGVATAIRIGGAGVVFWMWVSAFFCMAIKYSEIVLAVTYRERRGNCFYGGPMHYIGKGLNRPGLAAVFALFCAVSSFGIGGMAQSNTIAESVHGTFGFPQIGTGVLTAVVVAAVILGGVSRISSIAEKIIPVMSAAYMAAALAVIAANRTEALPVLRTIVAEAFSLRSAGGGLLGFAFLSAMRTGLSRGIFSNEAGLGSASIAHAAADTDSPVKQGYWGIFEVFFDTVVVCTVTAFVILTSGVCESTGYDGVALTDAAFATVFGDASRYVLTVSVTLFALPAIICWGFYGESSIRYLTGNRYAPVIYKVLFTGAVAAGAVCDVSVVWALSDVLNVFMAAPNMIAVIGLRGVVAGHTRRFLSPERVRDAG